MTSDLGSQNYETPREDTISMTITPRTLKQKEMMNNSQYNQFYKAVRDNVLSPLFEHSISKFTRLPMTFLFDGKTIYMATHCSREIAIHASVK